MFLERDEVMDENLGNALKSYEEVKIDFTSKLLSLLDRNLKGWVRNPGALYGRIITAFVVSLLILMVYWRVGYRIED